MFGKGYVWVRFWLGLASGQGKQSERVIAFLGFGYI